MVNNSSQMNDVSLNGFYCPITLELMRDPVICPRGHSFEKTAIEAWLLTHADCPIGKESLTVDQLTKNFNLHQAISDWTSKVGPLTHFVTGQALTKEVAIQFEKVIMQGNMRELKNHLKPQIQSNNISEEQFYHFLEGLKASKNVHEDALQKIETVYIQTQHEIELESSRREIARLNQVISDKSQKYNQDLQEKEEQIQQLTEQTKEHSSLLTIKDKQIEKIEASQAAIQIALLGSLVVGATAVTAGLGFIPASALMVKAGATAATLTTGSVATEEIVNKFKGEKTWIQKIWTILTPKKAENMK